MNLRVRETKNVRSYQTVERDAFTQTESALMPAEVPHRCVFLDNEDRILAGDQNSTLSTLLLLPA